MASSVRFRPREPKIQDTQQIKTDFSSIIGLKDDGITPGKLCQFCMDMFEGLTSEEISGHGTFDYHQNPGALLASVQADCALCTFVDQLLQRRDIQLSEDQTTRLQIIRDGLRIQGQLYLDRLSTISFMILTETVFKGRMFKPCIHLLLC
jgi:hypothetical protein